MITQQEAFASAVEPHYAASLGIHYPQFTPEKIPVGSNASAAWKGTLCPFLDDATAREVLRRLENNKPFDISAGTIFVREEQPSHLSPHWAEPALVKMNLAFSVLVLEYSGGAHSRAFALAPQISRQIFPRHPHLLDGITVQSGKHLLPALCIYSGAQFRYSGKAPRIVEFLDQVTTYLARHLIWRRTRRLFEASPGQVRQVYLPRPGELIVDLEPRWRTHSIANTRISPLRFWEGYWPGTVAPQGARQHLKTISPAHECWCCSGQPYGECHRLAELLEVGRDRPIRPV